MTSPSGDRPDSSDTIGSVTAAVDAAPRWRRPTAVRWTSAEEPAPAGRSGDLRLAAAGILVGTVLIVGSGLSRLTWSAPAALPLAALATVAYLPLHLRHLTHAMAGRVPPGDRWSLAAMAAVVLGVLPVLGVPWLGALYPLAASALCVLRGPWSYLTVSALAATAAITGGPEWGVYFALATLLYAAVLAVPAWLIGTARAVQTARARLAEEAVLRERLRIDGELRDAVGRSLEEIVALGERAGERAAVAPDAAGDGLRALVRTSREALAAARRTVRQYREPSLAGELATAVSLLRAAGVDAALAPARPETVPEAGEAVLAALRAEVARLLRDPTLRRCVFTVTSRGGRTGLRIDADGAGPVIREVTPT
jgi:two-component system, NarL family, sensor histidine kinase DesK